MQNLDLKISIYMQSDPNCQSRETGGNSMDKASQIQILLPVDDAALGLDINTATTTQSE